MLVKLPRTGYSEAIRIPTKIRKRLFNSGPNDTSGMLSSPQITHVRRTRPRKAYSSSQGVLVLVHVLVLARRARVQTQGEAHTASSST